MSNAGRRYVLLFAVFVAASSGCGDGGENGSSSDGAVSDGGVPDGKVIGSPDGPTALMDGGDITDDAGNVSADAYRAIAAVMNREAGIAYRYGQPSTATAPNQWDQAPSMAYPASSPYGVNTYWQVGGPFSSDAGDYSSTVGQVSFVPDDVNTYLGVGTLEFLAQRNNTFSEVPQISWPYGGDPQGGFPERNSRVYYKSSTPVAMGRCYARLTWCVNSVLAFQNGLLGTAGSNTASNHSTAQLDSGKVPTAVAVTNGGEFALVTVWDTVNIKGQIAVVALAGGCQDCADGKYWGEWTTLYPGLPNLNNISYMKVIGYVDLPGMTAPTEISVTTGLDNETLQRVYLPGCGGNFVSHEQLPLNDEANRQTFMPGAAGCNYNTYPHGGVAVVISKSESKAAFIDLKPLFDYYQSMYFGTLADFNKTATLGPGDNEWPYAFSAAPSQMPAVIKTIDLPHRPTAVKAALYSTQRAWIATEDGSLGIYSLGDYAYHGAATPNDIQLKGTVAVGTNPTALAYVKHDPADNSPYGTLNNNVIVVSRGERKIQWVTFAADNNSGSIRRTLQDARLQDPIWAEDADNHGTSSFVLTVADYAGKQVSNYRYGPVIFITNPGGACQGPAGCGMAGEFEFAGSYTVPGKAFQVTGANVP